MSEVNGKSNGSLLNGRTVGVSGLSGGLVIAAVSMFNTLQKDVGIAIDVAKQHGQEFVDVRSDIREVEKTLAELTAKMNLGGRFTRDDGDRLQLHVEALRNRVDSVEKDHWQWKKEFSSEE